MASLSLLQHEGLSAHIVFKSHEQGVFGLWLVSIEKVGQTFTQAVVLTDNAG